MDPVTLDICWSRLVGVVNEQAAALMRTSFTSIVREAGDLSAGVFDRRGFMVAQAVTGTPGHINSMALAMKHFLAACPVETIVPGDVLITNDPWKTSGHLNDVTICTPVFRGADCVAFFASTCHSADIGGHVLSAEAREVYEEGLFIPIMKLYEAGRLNRALDALIRANTRVPDLVMGDFHAQIAGGAVGGERLIEFMDEFGFERLEPLADEIIERTERAMRDAIRRLRPGAYEYAITSDGFGEPITIACRAEVRGDELLVDYTGSSPESRRGINVVMNYTEAYTTYGVKVIVSPEVPNNEGAFRPIRISAPAGSILNARHPAPVAARHVIGHFLPHAVAGALKQALPERVMAEGSANIWGIQVAGKDMERRPFTYVFFTSGGTGARADQGWALRHGVPVRSARHSRRGDRDAVPARHREEGAARRLGRRRAVAGRARSGHRVPSADAGALRVLGALRPHADRPLRLLRRRAGRDGPGADQRAAPRQSEGRADPRARGRGRGQAARRRGLRATRRPRSAAPCARPPRRLRWR